MRPKAYEELGKTALALAVAFIVFTFIKPFSEGKLNYDVVSVGIFMFIALVVVGIYLINKGGNKDES